MRRARALAAARAAATAEAAKNAARPAPALRRNRPRGRFDAHRRPLTGAGCARSAARRGGARRGGATGGGGGGLGPSARRLRGRGAGPRRRARRRSAGGDRHQQAGRKRGGSGAGCAGACGGKRLGASGPRSAAPAARGANCVSSRAMADFQRRLLARDVRFGQRRSQRAQLAEQRLARPRVNRLPRRRRTALGQVRDRFGESRE